MEKEPRIDKHPSPHHDEFDVLFEKMTEDQIDFVGKDKNGRWFYIDPFVGCAWNYENRNELVGKIARVQGFWSLNSKNGMPVFLVDEGGITFLPTLTQDNK